MLTLEELSAEVASGARRHGHHRDVRHAGPPAGQAAVGARVRRRHRRARRRGLQLPARRRRRHEPRRRATRCRRGSAATATSCSCPISRRCGASRGSRARSMVQCDLLWHDGSPVAASPRQVLRASARARRRARLARLRGLRARVHPLRRDLRLGARQELARAAAGQRLQRRLLDPRHDDGGARAAADPARHGGRGDARRGLQGRVQLRPARGQLPLPGGAADGGRPRRLPQRRQGDRVPAGQGAHVHAEVRRARGQLVPHPPEPLGGLREPLPGGRRRTA